MVVDRGDLGDGLAADLGGECDEFPEHEVARVLAELVDVGGGEAGGVDGIKNCEGDGGG